MRARPVIERAGDHLLADRLVQTVIWPRLPSYLKVYAELVAALRNGEYPPGAALPPRRVMCARYGVSRVTVAQATRLLTDAGLVETVRRNRNLRVAKADRQ